MSLAFLLLIPVIWMVVVKFGFGKTIDWREALLIMGVGLIITAGGWQFAKYSQAFDTEFLNGQVTGKKQVRVSCSHSYSCNCRTYTSGTGSNKTTRRTCDTCYEHSNDWDWDVFTNLGQTLTIDRVDRRGSNEPPRWTKVVVGEPVAIEHRYVNYIKGARDTVLKDVAVDVTNLAIPPYPRTFDYYRSERVLRVGTSFPVDAPAWNIELGEMLKILGPQKHANIILVYTSYPESYRLALKQEWIGGKSNDTIVVIGVDSAGQYVWSDAFGWSRSNNLYVNIKHDLSDLPDITDRKAVLGVIHQNVSKLFDRRSTSEFEYLANDFRPGFGLTLTLIILIMAALSGITYYAHREDIFARFSNRYRY